VNRHGDDVPFGDDPADDHLDPVREIRCARIGTRAARPWVDVIDSRYPALQAVIDMQPYPVARPYRHSGLDKRSDGVPVGESFVAPCYAFTIEPV